ncbi:MAG: hypothetical protein BAA01_09435 [Bacillus thermozeamaize]|uniref:Gp28/Gp37-like domain-containing protein n=1 Tax=Bacillus thermozeamaize TaxID=230954 RepID=A0A1Y3PED5_9BACI|nr:MAG: hypothetical protein BAA01_09435 [Bacillus thermozeamaize]
MKPIRILSPTLNLLAEIDDYESFIFTRRWHGVGEFELHINRHKQHTDKLQLDNLILLGSDTHKVGIIRHREIGLDESGKDGENWVIRGYELKGVVGQRLTLPPDHTAYDNKSGDVETVMKHYVDRNIVNPTDPKRKMPMLTMAPNQQRGPQVSWQSRFKNIAEELEAISLLTGVGWSVAVDYKNLVWVFDVAIGRDVTARQAVNPPVIFSPEYDSVKNLSLVDSYMNYRNTAYVAGQGEGVDRRVVEVGTAEGLDRFELFVDARDVAEETEDDPPQPRPEQEIIDDLENRGQQYLADYAAVFTLEGQILTNSPFQYERDWDLGDVVTVQNLGWGVTRDARVTEVKEIYEPSGFQLEVTFGQSPPTLIRKIKQELKQMSAEVRR